MAARTCMSSSALNDRVCLSGTNSMSAGGSASYVNGGTSLPCAGTASAQVLIMLGIPLQQKFVNAHTMFCLASIRA